MPTPAEAKLWEFLRDRQLGGLKFRRQHPFGGIIADFFCPEAELVVEVDGPVHLDPEQRDRDMHRDQELAQQGSSVLRFTNEEVQHALERVLGEIHAAAQARISLSE